MDNLTLDLMGELSDVAAESRRVLSSIRVMLWAGDYERAREALRRLNNEYGQQIANALALRNDVRTYERKYRKDFRESRRGQEISAAELQRQASSKAAQAVGEVIQGREASFMLGAISGVLAKLDKRISAERGEQPLLPDFTSRRARKRPEREENEDTGLPSVQVVAANEDAPSHFRYMQIRRDDGRWEWRAYRLENVDIGPELIEQQLSSITNLSIELWENAELEGKAFWPYRFRGFSDQAYVEITVFGPGRLLIEMTVKRHVQPQTYLPLIFAAFNPSKET